jgi:hypothetical protein
VTDAVAWGWGTLAFVFLYLALRLKGIRLRDLEPSDVYDSGPY